MAHLNRLIRCKELCELFSVSRSTIWRWVQNGRLPKPLRLGPNVVGWPEDVIERLLSAPGE